MALITSSALTIQPFNDSRGESHQWRRDLLANMIGHFLVDFIGVVVPRFFS